MSGKEKKMEILKVENLCKIYGKGENEGENQDEKVSCGDIGAGDDALPGRLRRR